jgi:hypothetical protein
MQIHDYFFVKSLDRLRPGGDLACVTPTGTMDKASEPPSPPRAERTLSTSRDRLQVSVAKSMFQAALRNYFELRILLAANRLSVTGSAFPPTLIRTPSSQDTLNTIARRLFGSSQTR